MNALQVVWTNHTAEDIVLPIELGQRVIPANSSKTIIHDRDNFVKYVPSGPTVQEQAITDLLSTRVIVTDEDSGVEAAGAGVYALEGTPRILPGSLTVTVPTTSGTFQLKDDGVGALDEVGGAGTGTVNYNTGAIALANDQTGVPAAEGAILLSYTRVDLSAVITKPTVTSNGLRDVVPA